ncbi:MAG TPA: TonB family protein [Pyrinomonadaceae bacterium]|nr:TonB family protein [Pyrinomonadaceae bacterium]
MKITFALVLVCLCAALPTRAQSGRRPAPKNDEQAEKRDDAPPAGERKAYSGREVTKRAVILSRPAPQYPRRARQSGVAGRVVLRLILAASGEVDERIAVVEGLPEGLTEAAIAAARKIKFIPAERDGQPVSQYVTVVYNFNLY